MEMTATHAPETKTTEAVAPVPTSSSRALDENGMAWVPESKFDALVEKTAKLNRRAAKLGCPPIVVEQVEERFIPIRKHNGVEWVTVGHKREIRVRVAGVAPQVAGWTFVARLQHGEGGNIVSKAPSERSTQLDEKVARDTLEWIRRRLDPTSDYERNLKVALTGEYIDPRNLGLVVSAVQAHLRRTGELERKANPPKRPSQHVGTVGTRLRDLPVKVVSTRQIVNDVTGWTSTLVVFETEDGDQLKWFATGEHAFTVGSKVSLTGTVKKHDEWKGTKATLLNRCVVEEAP